MSALLELPAFLGFTGLNTDLFIPAPPGKSLGFRRVSRFAQRCRAARAAAGIPASSLLSAAWGQLQRLLSPQAAQKLPGLLIWFAKCRNPLGLFERCHRRSRWEICFPKKKKKWDLGHLDCFVTVTKANPRSLCCRGRDEYVQMQISVFFYRGAASLSPRGCSWRCHSCLQDALAHCSSSGLKTTRLHGVFI